MSPSNFKIRTYKIQELEMNIIINKVQKLKIKMKFP